MATFEFINDVPLETSIPHGDVPLESILCTEELRRRPWRSRECDEDIHPKRLAAVTLGCILYTVPGSRRSQS